MAIAALAAYASRLTWLFDMWVVSMLAADLAALSGRYVNPSLVEYHPYSVDRPLTRELGFFGFVLDSWWGLYSFMVQVVASLSGTRKFLTHTPVVSTIIRVAFGDVPILLGIFLIELLFNFTIPPEWALPALAGQLFGLTATDIAYVLVNRGGRDRKPALR